jgi:hypothetical protein
VLRPAREIVIPNFFNSKVPRAIPMKFSPGRKTRTISSVLPFVRFFGFGVIILKKFACSPVTFISPTATFPLSDFNSKVSGLLVVPFMAEKIKLCLLDCIFCADTVVDVVKRKLDSKTGYKIFIYA